MRKIREVLRLKFEQGLNDRQVGQSVGLARSTVQEYLLRARTAGVVWPLPAELDDQHLEALLFRQEARQGEQALPLPDWTYIDQELRRKGVTRQLLWEEYRRQHPDGVQYATFNEHYREWKALRGLSMRQYHRAGEKLFVDYAGLTLPITEARTGTVQAGQVFVATLGASDYCYVEVTASQGSEDWLSSHVRALEFFVGVPEIIVPDNLKSGVTQAHRYDPSLNRAYAEFAAHYGVAVIPARVRKPKDKALVEVHVQIVERRLLAPLRNRVFFSLREANEAIWEGLHTLNHAPFQKRPGSRFSLFVAVDQPTLRPLPVQPFEVATWKSQTVGLDYHVTVLGHAYSVPHQYAKTKVDLKIMPHLIEVYADQRRIATHHRNAEVTAGGRRATTLKEHMPPHHQHWNEQSAEGVLTQAEAIGSFTLKLLQGLMTGERHSEQELRSAQGILRLEKAYGATRLEAACRRAVFLHAYSGQSVESILKHRLDEAALPSSEPVVPVAVHGNLRGPAYYGQSSTAETEAEDPSLQTPLTDFDPTLN